MARGTWGPPELPVILLVLVLMLRNSYTRPIYRGVSPTKVEDSSKKGRPLFINQGFYSYEVPMTQMDEIHSRPAITFGDIYCWESDHSVGYLSSARDSRMTHRFHPMDHGFGPR